jgi:hypothetical protein
MSALLCVTFESKTLLSDEFSRAVKICTGYALSEHLIDTVFAIFDEDGDGLLSYKEFIAIMKVKSGRKPRKKLLKTPLLLPPLQDRLHRGMKVSKKKLIDNYLDEYEDHGDGFSLLSILRSRACRKIASYLINSPGDLQR